MSMETARNIRISVTVDTNKRTLAGTFASVDEMIVWWNAQAFAVLGMGEYDCTPECAHDPFEDP